MTNLGGADMTTAGTGMTNFGAAAATNRRRFS